VDYSPGYIAIAIELLATVTGLEGIDNFTTLRLFVHKKKEFNTIKIQNTQQLFHDGLVIKLFQE